MRLLWSGCRLDHYTPAENAGVFIFLKRIKKYTSVFVMRESEL